MKRIFLFYLLTCLCTPYVTLRGMDFHDGDSPSLDSIPTLTNSCTKIIVDKIDKTIKEFHANRVPVQSLIRHLNEFISSLHFVARDIICDSLIDRHASRTYYQCHAHTQCYDGRILSLADRLNTPDMRAASPWKTLQLEELIRTHCITHYEYKACRSHPFAQIPGAQVTRRSAPESSEYMEELVLPAAVD
jgi:hypothetical protein